MNYRWYTMIFIVITQASLESKSESKLLQVLFIKPFLTLWLAQLISQIAVNMLTFVLGVIVYQQTKSNTAVSLLYLTVGIPAVIFGTLSGVYVDRLNKRMVLIITTSLRVVLLLLVLLAQGQLVVLYLLVALVSTISQFFVPAEAALIPQYVPEKLLLSANSLFSLTFYSAIIGGFVVGGPLLALFGESYVMLLLAALFALSVILLMFLPKIHQKEPADKAQLRDIWNDLVEGLRYIKRTDLIKQAILILAVAQAIIAIFLALGPGFADTVLSIRVTDASLLILGPAALGLIVGALLTGSFGMQYRKRKLILFGVYLSGAVMLFIGLVVRTRRYGTIVGFFENAMSISLDSAILPVAMICFLILGFANSLIDVSCNTVLQEQTPPEIRGRVYGVLSSLISGVGLVPVVISGILADLIGIGKILFILGLVITGLGIYINGGWRKLGRVAQPN